MEKAAGRKLSSSKLSTKGQGQPSSPLSQQASRDSLSSQSSFGSGLHMKG